MKILGWDVGFSRNIAVGIIWTSPGYSSIRANYRGIAFLFLGLIVSRSFPGSGKKVDE